ncbi:hypothetical protein EST38_g2008 [Candolleomyces aberdarensis]|uniref:RIC1 C-terminal alpha solenoid region domain-containing protein n=1 Tax=Candolleomyces aberdarensis TaxID=2316362 RepID=A0A4Q2DXV4_9AGAR|nr:hypothetical protein EST38_g2008 [Candolleomyces aberdarensis]
MPWPTDEEGLDAENPAQLGYDTWLINEDDFGWLVEQDVTVVDIVYSRPIGSETWITSDGRVYLVQLHEDGADVHNEDNDRPISRAEHESIGNVGWHGSCIHNFETPKWFQKQRYVDPNEPTDGEDRKIWEEPRRATAVAVNYRFSVFAIGTTSGQLEFTPFPSQGNVVPKSQKISIPNAYNRPTGEVRSLDWSSDGYVLAVGWSNGWGVFSVGGRCLASSFNMEHNVDMSKFQDPFMFGVHDLFWGPGNFDLFLLSRKVVRNLGDPVDDLSVATVLMVVGGQLILLRPCKAADQEVKYDLQVFADRIEFCWIHLRGIGALENSLWAYDAHGMRIWLNALSIEKTASEDVDNLDVKESVNIPLDFYPLSVLMDKGIIIGAEHEIATRMNLSFVMFRHTTSSHLFLQHILLYYLGTKQVKNAVQFASHYRKLVYFSHALEVLLHTVVEAEAGQDESDNKVLPTVVDFLDHFDVCLDVVVGCARKTEVDRWRGLFDIVGNPKTLFEECLSAGKLKTAGSYLLVLHTLEQLDSHSTDAIRLLRCAVDEKEWDLCKELLRFLQSIDDTGGALRHAVAELQLEEMPV